MEKRTVYDKKNLEAFVKWFPLALSNYKEKKGTDEVYKMGFEFYKNRVVNIYDYVLFKDSEYTFDVVYAIVDSVLDFYNEYLKPEIISENLNRMNRKCKFYPNNNLPPEVKKFLVHFTGWATVRLGLNSQFNVIFSKKGGVHGISTGGFDPSTNDVISRIEGRAPIDCVRTIAHELVHLKQKEDGKIQEGVPVQDIGGDIENEANALAGVLVKEYAAKFGRWIYDL